MCNIGRKEKISKFAYKSVLKQYNKRKVTVKDTLRMVNTNLTN